MSKLQITKVVGQIGEKLGKFKFPLLILLIGVLLMALPVEKKEDHVKPVVGVTEAGDTLQQTETKMEEILSQVEGAGRVKVMLEYAGSTKTIYQQDTEQEVSTNETGKESRTKSSTVLTSDAEKGPVPVQTIYPVYRGAVVVADGAMDDVVKLNLVNAVSGLTGLGADKITVMKMKKN